MDIDGLKQRKKQDRYVACPKETIKDAIGIMQKIASQPNLDFTKPIEQSAICTALGVVKWGSIKLQVSTCVQYGLLINKKGVGYRASDLFFQYLKPTNNAERLREMRREMFKNVELYKGIIGNYGGKALPSPKALPIILRDEFGVSEHSMIKAAKVLSENIKDLEIKEHGSNILTITLMDSGGLHVQSNKNTDYHTNAVIQSERIVANPDIKYKDNLKVTIQVPMTCGSTATITVDGEHSMQYLRDLITTVRSV